MNIIQYVRHNKVTLGVLVAVLSFTAYKLTPPKTQTLSRKSIVKVLNLAGNGGGTGWVANSGGKKVIVTNDHVCGVEFGGFVRIEDDDGQPSIKRIIKRNFTRDLCLVEGVDAPALTIASSPARIDDTVKVLGHPGLRPTAPASGTYTGNGIVPIGFGADPAGACPDGSEAIQSMFGTFCVLVMELGYTTVPIMPGNSGSPITNADGEVIGVINSADSTGNQGMFIPLNYLKDMLGD